VSKLPSPPSRLPSSFVDTLILKLWWLAAGNKVSLIDCGGAYATNLAINVVRASRRQVPIVFHCWGVEAEEMEYLNRARGGKVDAKKVTRLKALQSRALAEADAIVCVSRAMVRYLMSEYSLSGKPICVVPCCVDTGVFSTKAACRHDVRSKLKVDGRLVVSYCGSLAAWQLPEVGIKLFRTIKCLEPSAYFLALTTQGQRMLELLHAEKLSPSDYTVMSVPHADVPKYLGAADIGLLLRESSPVNQVASPVKFAEYLACGVPVILSEGIGDYSEAVRQNHLGFVLDSLTPPFGQENDFYKFIQGVFTERQLWAKRCVDYARQFLDWDPFIPVLTGLYEEAFNKRFGKERS